MSDNTPIELPPEKHEASSAEGKFSRAKERTWFTIIVILGGLLIIDLLVGYFLRSIRSEGWETYDLGSSTFGIHRDATLVIDQYDRVWTTDANGDLIFLEPDGQVIKQEEMAGKYVRDIVIDDKGQIWICADEAVYILSSDGSLVNQYVFSERRVATSAVAIDAYGKPWVGVHFRKSLAGAEEKVGEVRVLESDGTWSHYSPPYESKKGDRWIRDIGFDETGNAWILTQELHVLQPNGDWKTIPTLVSADVLLLIEREGGQAWIGGTRRGEGGIKVLDLNGSQLDMFTTSDSELAGDSINSLTIDKEGSVWIGTSREFAGKGGGLNVVDSEGNWLTYTSENSGLGGNSVAGVDFDSHGNVWILSKTERGKALLNSFDPDEVLPSATQGRITSFYARFSQVALPILVFLMCVALIGLGKARGRKQEADVLTGSGASVGRKLEMSNEPSNAPPEPVTDLPGFLRRYQQQIIGFAGWFIINGLYFYNNLGAHGASISDGENYTIMLISGPVNLLVLIVSALNKPTRRLAFGILLAMAVNLVIAIFLGVGQNAMCFVPFFQD